MNRLNKITIPLLCAAAVALASCSKDDTTPAEQGMALTITVLVDGNDTQTASNAGTRATDTGYATAFDAGDALGIYAYDGTTLKFSNKRWVFNGTSWAPATADDKIFCDGPELTLRAYFPYDASATALPAATTFAVKADQSTAAGYRASDLLLSADASWNGAEAPVALNFSHAMALVEAFPLNAAPMTSVTLGVVSLIKGGAAANITMRPMGDGTWRAAIPAQDFAATSKIFCTYSTAGSYDCPVSGSATAAASLKFTLTTLPAAIGDYYYFNGSYSTALIASRTPIGVVCALDNPVSGRSAHGKIVSLNEGNDLTWGYDNMETMTGINSSSDGATATKNLISALSGYNDFSSSYETFNWIYVTKNASNADGRWYLPAINELSVLYDSYDTYGKVAFNTKLTTVGGTAFSANLYWSSTQGNAIGAWSVSFDDGTSGGIAKSSRKKVRAVSAF